MLRTLTQHQAPLHHLLLFSLEGKQALILLLLFTCKATDVSDSALLVALKQEMILILLRILQVGEVMDGRYEVFATHGKGVFSTVLRARDLKSEGGVGEVAIKIIRANETMYKAAQTEKVRSALLTSDLQ